MEYKQKQSAVLHLEKKRKKKFIFYINALQDRYFTTDVGIIPFVMQKYHGYEIEIIAEGGKTEFASNKTYTENMKVSVVADKEDMHQRISEADVLYLFGIYEHNFAVIKEYQHRNPDGKIYCKLDMNEVWLLMIAEHQFWWAKHFWNQCDLVTVECKRLQNLISLYWGNETKYIPNGYYHFWEDDLTCYTSKSNIILTVGRPGEYVKNTELMLNAFVNIYQHLPDWKLVMVGKFEPHFEKQLQLMTEKFPNLKEKVVLTGHLSKEDVRSYFKKAKVFCHTSRWEACSNVLAESLGSGCYPIFTDFNGVASLLQYGKYGTIIPPGDQLSLEESLLKVCKDDQLMKETSTMVQEYARTEINWVTLCKQIDQWLIVKT